MVQEIKDFDEQVFFEDSLEKLNSHIKENIFFKINPNPYYTENNVRSHLWIRK